MFLRNRHRLPVRIALMLLAILLFLLAYQWGNQYQRHTAAPPTIGGLLIRPPASLPDVTLRDAPGRSVDRADLADGWTLLAFGDLSRASGQLAVQRLIDIYNRLADARALRKRLRLVLVTARDDTHLARDFTGLLPALSILSGEVEEVRGLRTALGLDDADSASVFVIAPGGYLVAFLTEAQDAAAMAEDIREIHDKAFLLLPETP